LTLVPPVGFLFEEALEKVVSEGQARQNQAKKRNLRGVNEHFESDFNTT
jgi:hypothetical protein